MKKEILRTIKYFLLAASAGIIETVVFALLEQLDIWPYWPCYLIALVISVIWNFTLNRRFTFHSNGNYMFGIAQEAVYYAVFTPVSTILGQYCVTMGANDFVVMIITLLLNGITEFLWQRFVIFRKTLDATLDANKVKVQPSVHLSR